MKNINRLAGGMMRFSFEITLVLALSVLAVISVQYAHGASASAVNGRDVGSRTPVLIELFTSEGCSSCPPAQKGTQSAQAPGPAPFIWVYIS
jgi:hypothetical protein